MNIPLWRPIDAKFEGVSQGEATEELEITIANYLGVRYALATSSGTTALFLALKANGIGEGHKVLVPDLTAIGTINGLKTQITYDKRIP